MAPRIPELDEELQSFIDAHPEGWTHQDWQLLLLGLDEAGVDTSRPDVIGLELESIRLLRALESYGLKGLGPKRRQAVARHFGTLWELQQASQEDLEAIPRLPRRLRRALAQAVHGK